MKNNKKTIMIVSIIIGVLVLTIGLTYSIFTISKTGSNSKLVVGDVYMHYKETTNSINLTNQMPLAEKYIVNPNMANQTYQEDTRNELSKCVDVGEGSRFDEGSTAETYCKGTGTIDGTTFQKSIDNGREVSYFKELNIVTSDNKVNPDMANQIYQDDSRNEISICTDRFMAIGASKDEAMSLCKGNSLDNGLTLQLAYEQGLLDNENLTNTFIKNNVLTTDLTTLPYFEFTIDGKNTTTNKDIWYEIILKHGDEVSGKTRIKDNLLKFTLTETKDGETSTIFSGATYNDLTSKRVYVNTINRNTTTDVNITYRLYMWISNDTMICAGDPKDNCDYYTDNTPNWNDVFASIKVDVAGDFNEKYIETDASCFETYESNYYIPNPIMKIQEYTKGGTNELSKCVDYYLGFGATFDDGTTAETYCKGEGTMDERKIEYDVVNSRNDEFINNNVVLVEDGVVISGYDTSCGSDVVIPKTINNKRVFEVGLGAFRNSQLTNVKLLEGLIIIDYEAFKTNNIVSVEIPDSVIYLSCGAFDNNVSITKNSNLKCAVVLL